MELTKSFERVVPADVLVRYDWREVRNAAAVLRSTNPVEFDDLLEILRGFTVRPERDITPPGGNESLTASHLNKQFRERGWREGSYGVGVSSTLRLLPWAEAGETEPLVTKTETDSESYLVDNIKGRVAIDVEWHAKDGNLDRDIAAYRALYDSTIVDAAVLLTMTRSSMREWALLLDSTTTKFQTSTTTNLEKAEPRLLRGDGGGCPILVVAVCRRTV